MINDSIRLQRAVAFIYFSDANAHLITQSTSRCARIGEHNENNLLTTLIINLRSLQFHSSSNNYYAVSCLTLDDPYSTTSRCDSCQRKYLKEKSRREQKVKRKQEGGVSDDEEVRSEKSTGLKRKISGGVGATPQPATPFKSNKVQKQIKTRAAPTSTARTVTTEPTTPTEMYVVNPGAQSKIDVPPIRGATLKWIVCPVFLLPDGESNE